jgi:hypothetical protein
MVGDIDFIFSKEDYPKAITVLRDNGYFPVHELRHIIPYFKRHYLRLKIKNNIAAVEIHNKLLIEKYTNEFNYSIVAQDPQTIHGFAVLSYANKLNLSILANQINDNGFLYKTINLRNAYDVFLLSKKTDAKAAVNTLDSLRHPLNCFVAACDEVFNKPASLEYHKTSKTRSYLPAFTSHLIHTRKRKRHYYLIKNYLFIREMLTILSRFIWHKGYRGQVLKKLKDKNWYKKKEFS